MQDLSSVEFFSPRVQPLHPVIYATAGVLLLCLLTIIISYIYHHRYLNFILQFTNILWVLAAAGLFDVLLTFVDFVDVVR